MISGQAFWNRIADRYAARAIKDVAAYEATLVDVASRLRPDARVLEIGCGTGGTAIRLAPGVARYLATDYSAEMIRIARAKPAPANLTFRLAEAERAFDDGPFDAVCAFNVLHLAEDLPALLEGIRASLAPRGQLVAKVWCLADLPLHLRAVLRLMRLANLFPPAQFLSQAKLRRQIEAAGLAIVDQKVFGARPQNPYLVAGLPGPRPPRQRDHTAQTPEREGPQT